jgi:hypothetical protein
MFIHLIPKLFFKYANHVSILSLEVPELSIYLTNDDLVSRKPFPNKCYHVACKRKGKKAIKGILLESDKHLSHFQVKTKWLIDNEEEITHVVNYNVIDDEFSLVSDDFTLMYASSGVLGDFDSRWNSIENNFPPCQGQPFMEYVDVVKKDKQNVLDTIAFPNQVVHREEFISIPTIEMERFTKRGEYEGRFPEIPDKFSIKTLALSHQS